MARARGLIREGTDDHWPFDTMTRSERDTVTNEETRDYISRLARHHGVNEAANADKFPIIESLLLPPAEAPRLLECGGGAGFYTRRLLELGYEVTTVDLSEDALAQNRATAEADGRDRQLTTVCGDFVEVATTLQRDFDQVLFVKVLHHFESLEAIQRALRAAVERCRPGGRVVVFEPNGRNPLWRLAYSLRRDPDSGRTKWFYEQNMRFTTVPLLTRELAGHGTRIGYHYVLPAGATNRWRAANKLNGWLESTPLRRTALNISVSIDC